MARLPNGSTHSAVSSRPVGGGSVGGQPASRVPVRVQSPPGTELAISWPVSCGWLEPLTMALGARIRPFQATPVATLSAVARGRFQMSRSAAPAGVTLRYCGAIVRLVLVLI